MSIERITNIRNFIFNEMDNGIYNTKIYFNKDLDIEYYTLNYLNIYIHNPNEINKKDINKIFREIGIKTLMIEKINHKLYIRISLDYDFKLLNRKRKLKLLEKYGNK